MMPFELEQPCFLEGPTKICVEQYGVASEHITPPLNLIRVDPVRGHNVGVSRYGIRRFISCHT